MTREAFLAEYRKRLLAYGWAQEPSKLDKFMESVVETLTTTRITCNLATSEMAKEAFVAIGGQRSKYSVKALRALQ